MDEQALAEAQPGLREERVVGGGEDLGDAARRLPLQLLRHRHRRALVDDRELGLSAAGHDRHHAVAGLEALHAGPDTSTTSPASSSPGTSCGAPGGAG